MCVAGAVVGTIVYAPTSVYQSLAAGIGWTGAMNVLLTSRHPETERVQEIVPPQPRQATSGIKKASR